MTVINSKNDPDVLLACRGLSVGYNGRTVLEGIDLDFGAGQFISLLGPNGAGKTTLLRTLSRHLEPVAGTILVSGRPLAGMAQKELARIMAVVLTDRVTPPLFSAFQFAALGRYPHTGFLGRLGEQDRLVVRRALAAVHADDLRERDFASLSDGERQKVLVARALAQEPRILLLDEPTAHLDLKHRLEVMAILRDLCRSRGITVLASLHDVDIAARVSDTVVLVRDGAITASGSPEDVLTGDSVARLYDFDEACFSHRLGAIELRAPAGGDRVFVVGGGGSGAPLYRMLARRGHGIATGVLMDNDLDRFVAAGLGAKCVCQPLAGSLSDARLAEAMALLEECPLVIDAGFGLRGPYRDNLRLLTHAAARGLRIFTLRRDALPLSCAGGTIIPCTGAGQLLTAMEDCGLLDDRGGRHGKAQGAAPGERACPTEQGQQPCRP